MCMVSLSVAHHNLVGVAEKASAQGSRSEIEANLGNELRHPCWMSGHPDSSGTVGRKHQGNYCTYCMQRGDSFAGLYLFDFPLKIVKV